MPDEHSREFYQEKGFEGGKKLLQERGREYFVELGRRGRAKQLTGVATEPREAKPMRVTPVKARPSGAEVPEDPLMDI